MKAEGQWETSERWKEERVGSGNAYPLAFLQEDTNDLGSSGYIFPAGCCFLDHHSVQTEPTGLGFIGVTPVSTGQ